MKSEVLDMIIEGESELLELKTSIRDPQLLSKLIASFANAKGGKIVVGVEESLEVVGVDEQLVRRVYDATKNRLTPYPETTFCILESEGKKIAVINVQRSEEIVLAEGSAYVRTGTMMQPMAWTQMREHLPKQPNAHTIELLTKSIERQSKMLDEMRTEIREANSPNAKWKERVIGFVIGIVASGIASLLF